MKKKVIFYNIFLITIEEEKANWRIYQIAAMNG